MRWLDKHIAPVSSRDNDGSRHYPVSERSKIIAEVAQRPRIFCAGPQIAQALRLSRCHHSGTLAASPDSSVASVAKAPRCSCAANTPIPDRSLMTNSSTIRTPEPLRAERHFGRCGGDHDAVTIERHRTGDQGACLGNDRSRRSQPIAKRQQIPRALRRSGDPLPEQKGNGWAWSTWSRQRQGRLPHSGRRPQGWAGLEPR